MKFSLEEVADFVEQGINHYTEPKVQYNIFCGPGHPASDEMIVAQLANHFTTRELRIMLNCISYGENDPAGIPGHNLLMIVTKLLGLTSITKELIHAAIVERQGEVCVDWNGDEYKGDNW